MADFLRIDRELFSSLLKHIVQTPPNEDSSDYVLETIGRNVGADRCYVYWFWDPGKSSMCTNTHEWCAEGIKPEIGGQQTCNLADLVEFNACITSGRDFLFTDIGAIDAGSREWLEPQGIKSLIATPLVGAGGTIYGFAGFDFVKAPCAEFTDRIIFNIHEAADLLLNCQRMREHDVASALEREEVYRRLAVTIKVTNLKSDVIEYMFKHRDYARIREYIGRKVCAITGAQHLMLCSDDGARADWFGKDAPECCRRCAKASSCDGKRLPQEFFAESETVIIREGEPRPDMNLPPYCPMRSCVVSQFRKGDGWWRLVADYTMPHRHDLDEIARGLRVALELLVISFDRERHEKTITSLQEHQRFRADTLAYALSMDDIPGLIDLTLHRLLDLTECDYIALHSVAGDHKLLFPGGELEECPGRCERCSFYGLSIPPGTDANKVIELNDAKGQSLAPLAPDCPAKSLAVAIVLRDGKPWGGIALHYLNRQRKISQDDRQTLKIAANVLALALERHSAAARLEAERDRAVAAEKSRSYFFSTVSHDIRTPLNVIIGFSELLQSGDVPPEEARKALKMIVSSGKTLLQLVNDILDLSKMDAGKLKLGLEPTDVGELVMDLVQTFTPMAVQKGQTIVTEIADLPLLKIDPHRFRQVLFNFLGNAVKYAGPCTIRISVSYENGLLKTTVADNGRGVPAEKAKRLMEPFAQADIKDRIEGSGLGLAICKRLVEIVHGTILIDTAPGKGFAVRTEVPTEVAPPEGEGSEAAIQERPVAPSNLPRRVLAVDDLAANRAVLKAILVKLGVAEVELAEDGKAALDKLEKDPAFDLVMTDMWMPIMDGTELVRCIRADARLAHLKVCAITADVEARSNYREQGFDMLLLKPATIEKVAELFADRPPQGS